MDAIKKSQVSLSLISAYWCNSICPQYEDRFRWASIEVDEIVKRIGPDARRILAALAETVPDKHNAAFFAAGPLENYINLIIEEANANEASYIRKDPRLRSLLKYVWGDKKNCALLRGEKLIQFSSKILIC